ncbi:VTT domain-containing protein [Peribacillus sp. SCS-37]|uniref:VTT domain-containing protein n=1 Tax=Paraperibacillus esterisolvens TaxID=3115296 RepID=UPI0039063BE4
MPDIIHLLDQYGYIVLFLSLMLELIILPIPNEALMSYVGVLCYQGKMSLIISIVSAGMGGIIGVTISYWLGYKLGAPFFRKYGRYIHMGPEKMENMSGWYTKYGKVLLLVSFFIPGVRHIASLISGVIKLPFRSFAFFAYIGVFLWVGTFIWIGKIMGPNWDQFEGEIKKWLILASVLFGLFGLIYIVVRRNKTFIKESLTLLFESVFYRFKSYLKIKFLILTILLVFVAAFTLMVGFIQDLISNEVAPFNDVFKTIVFSLFNHNWSGIMKIFYGLGSWITLGIIIALTLLVIMLNPKHRRLELLFFVVAWVGTYVLNLGVHWIFHVLAVHDMSPSFPSDRSMIVMTVYGLLFIAMIRHSPKHVVNVCLFLLFLLVELAFLISSVYLHHLRPGDVLAGYIFSSVWVTGTILSLELFRFLTIIKQS